MLTPGRRFERVVWQVTFKHIEGEHLQVGIDDMSPGDVQSGEIYGALCKPHTGRKGARYCTVAAYGEGHAIALTTCHEVGQVKGVNVVTFDDVRVTFPQQVDQLS